MTLQELLAEFSREERSGTEPREQVTAVRRVLERAAAQPAGSDVRRSLVEQAARLVSDSWPIESALGATVIAYARAGERPGR